MYAPSYANSDSLFHTSLHFPSPSCFAVRLFTWASIPSPMDLCRVWECQLLLRHHVGLEPSTVNPTDRYDIRGPER